MNPRPQATKNGGLQQLQQLLFPSPLEPIYVAIDFERTGFIISNFSPRSDTQVGISILDTRDLNLPSRKKALRLATYNFVTGSDLYCAESAKKYLWGTSEKISPSSMLKTISKYACQDRNIVLVGHGFGQDLAALSSLGFDFQASVIGILDTANVATELQMNLSTLGRLEQLGCPKSSARLHNAGNDANFTLRALILLAIKGYDEQTLDTSRVEEERVDALRAVAMTPLPLVRLKPKKKRLRKKDIAKTWSLEKQEEIREERRQKRMMTAVAEAYIS
jgi:DNA polymerase III epsilon subunit-like protein